MVKIATPTAVPSCRPVLNTVEAAPVSAGAMVANAQACNGTRACAQHRPCSNISARIHHKLVPGPTVVISAVATATPSAPPVIIRRGPTRG